MMTTARQPLLGALPLARRHGGGSELRRPLGIAIVGGLLVVRSSRSTPTPVMLCLLPTVSRPMGSGSRGLPHPAALETRPPITRVPPEFVMI